MLGGLPRGRPLFRAPSQTTPQASRHVLESELAPTLNEFFFAPLPLQSSLIGGLSGVVLSRRLTIKNTPQSTTLAGWMSVSICPMNRESMMNKQITRLSRRGYLEGALCLSIFEQTLRKTEGLSGTMRAKSMQMATGEIANTAIGFVHLIKS